MAETKNEASEIARAIVESNRQLAESLKPQHPLARAGFTPEQIAVVDLPPVPRRWRKVACKSEETAATFDANVVESKPFANGRISAISNYRHPSSAYIFQSAGGRVPDGMQIFISGATTLREGEEPRPDQLTAPFKQWRYEEFWKLDLRRYIGRELTSHVCENSNDIKTPWQEGRVGALHD